MNLNSFTFSRERRQFGRQCTFSDRNELLFSIPQRADLRSSYIRRNPVNCGTQLGAQKALTTALTENVTLATHGIVHLEGGWPKDVNTLDEEQTLRHRKKVEREDSWGVQVVDLSKSATDCVLQNSAINIYEDYFSDLQPADIRSTFTSRPVNVFHDARCPSRPIVQIDWSPGNQRHLLSVHSILDYYPSDVDPNEFFLWDIENPLKPVLTFRGPTWTRKACFCPRDEALIAGGFTNGKVCIWDARVGGSPVEMCPLEAAHREAVTALCWVHSKSNTEFYSGSADGSIHYWDGRNLKKWYMEFLLDTEKTDNQLRSRASGCTVLEFEYTIPIRYVVGDDRGNVFLGNRKGMTPTEALILNYKLFSGPIRTIERNPFFVKNFLIVGDWCAKVWSEECKDFPTTLLVRKNVQFMCGTWSTSRCSVFVTGDMNGAVDFWDLLLNQTTPVFTLNLGHTVSAIKFRKDGEMVAVSLLNGDIRLLELDEALRSSGAKEKSLLAALFERETYRSKLLQDRIEEVKLREALATAAKQKDVDEMVDYGTFEKGGGEEGAPGTTAGAEPEELEEEEEEIDPDPEFTQVRENFLRIINDVREKWKERQFTSEHSPFEGDYYEVMSTSDTVIDEHEGNELE